MRRDWQYISVLLDVVEKLAGHPNLKQLRDEANEDLSDMLMQKPYPGDDDVGYHEEIPPATPKVEGHTGADGPAWYPPSTEPSVPRRTLT